MITTPIKWFLAATSLGFFGVFFVNHSANHRELQYNQYKAPMVEETQPKSEPRPVYPPTKKKPYTRVTRMA